MRVRRIITIVMLSLGGIVLALVVLPPLLLRDAQAPATLSPFIDGARAQLKSELVDGPLFWWPNYLRFTEARCSVVYPGRVALVFELWRPPYVPPAYAVAMRGSMPSSTSDSWGGGWGIGSVYGDTEFIYQMGADAVP